MVSSRSGVEKPQERPPAAAERLLHQHRQHGLKRLAFEMIKPELRRGHRLPGLRPRGIGVLGFAHVQANGRGAEAEGLLQVVDEIAQIGDSGSASGREEKMMKVGGRAFACVM